MSTTSIMRFEIDTTVSNLGVTVGFLTIDGLDNRQIDPRFEAHRQARLASLHQGLADDGWIRDPRIAGYRQLHNALGLESSSMTPSPESLLKLLAKHGSLRPINPLVDIYNLVALAHRLSCGAHDVDQLQGLIKLARLDGSETFIALGQKKVEAITAGEHGYIDGAGRLICRRECKQGAHSAVSRNSTRAVVICQGHRNVGGKEINGALDEIETLIDSFMSVRPRISREILGRDAASVNERCYA